MAYNKYALTISTHIYGFNYSKYINSYSKYINSYSNIQMHVIQRYTKTDINAQLTTKIPL